MTFDRILQTALEDRLYSCEINRIRHCYVEIAPEIERCLIESTHDDAPGVLQSIGIKLATWQCFPTDSGMVAVINSILVGVSARFLSRFAFSLSLYARAGSGIAVFAGGLSIHHRYQLIQFTEVGNRLKILFPGDTKKNE